MIPLFKAPLSDRAPEAAAAVIAHGGIDRGDQVAEFESAIGDKIGNPWVVAVDGFASGLRLALHLATGGPHGNADDGEVLSVPFAAAASTSAVLASGFPVRWVDVDPATLAVDLDDLARKISSKTRAVVLSHFLGSLGDLERLGDILHEAEIAFGVRPAVIEDAAHAWGATFRDKPIGTHSTIAVFSFSDTDLLTCGAGAALALSDEGSHHRAKLLRSFGVQRSTEWVMEPPDVVEWGYDCPMNDLNAAIGLANIAEAERAVAAHRENAAYYDRELASLVGLDLVERADDWQPSFWSYPLLVNDRAGFIRHLEAAGIEASAVQGADQVRAGMAYRRALLPGFDRVAERAVRIPVGWWMTEEQLHHVVATIKNGW